MPRPSTAAKAPAAGATSEAATEAVAPVVPLHSVQPVQLPRAPWSAMAPDFIQGWGYPDGKYEPEHVEILGPTGSGKTYFEATILQERVYARGSGVVFIATKPADKTIQALGWPVVTDWKGVQQNRQCIFWPRTSALGTRRKEYMAAKIDDLLSRLWTRDSANIVAFDEIATVEQLSPDLKNMIQMYWREARSVGITIVAMKQRPQGVQRDMHSEASWVVSFKPKDADDAIRYAEILGGRRQWQPVLNSLNRDRHEFVIKYERTGSAAVSWVDIPLRPARKPRPYERNAQLCPCRSRRRSTFSRVS